MDGLGCKGKRLLQPPALHFPILRINLPPTRQCILFYYFSPRLSRSVAYGCGVSAAPHFWQRVQAAQCAASRGGSGWWARLQRWFGRQRLELRQRAAWQ